MLSNIETPDYVFPSAWVLGFLPLVLTQTQSQIELRIQYLR